MIIKVNSRNQELTLYNGEHIIKTYTVSTGKNGMGELINSEKTPRGNHIIQEKIGEGAPLNTVFKGRVPNGEICSDELYEKNSGRDWILTRILWLCGTEKGKNQGGDVDTLSRYIYIHGAPDKAKMGQPGSRGCIRMHNKDMVELFDTVAEGTPIIIE